MITMNLSKKVLHELLLFDTFPNYKLVCKLVDNNDGIVALIGPADRDLSLQMSKIASSVNLTI
jgi:hypothetical protein